MPEVKPELPAPRAQTAVCVCGAARSQEDPPVIFPHSADGPLGLHIQGVLLQGSEARWLRSCRWCGVVYVVPERFRVPQ